MNSRRLALLAGSLIVPLALIVVLFAMLGVTLGDLLSMLVRTPAWLVAAMLVITLANQVISVIRWRAASRWLNPQAELVAWGPALEATVWGSFLGQLLPLQLSMTVARWARSRNYTTVSATLYEQLFDLMILLSGASAATVLLVFHGGPQAAAAVLTAALVAGSVGVRWLLGLAALTASVVARSGLPGSGFFGRLAEPLAKANRAPRRLLALMAGLSALRLAILTLRAVLVASAFVTITHWATVVVGYPIVGLALGVPFVPAGLGVADWSLTGILVLAGAAAPAAAMTAAAMRLITAASQGTLLIVLLPFRTRGAHRSAVAVSVS